ncbi:MAG: DUF1822 family protein [Symploca sp. SIO2E9]|nr:DUF1822 family protein [Symploca sp. SIO2E9]
MKSNRDDLALICTDQLFLEFSVAEREEVWQQTESRKYANTSARWNAYLNCLCLNTFLSYLESEPDLHSKPQVWPQRNELPSFWQVLNGTAIEVDKTRLVLIPTEDSEFAQLCVPREWVDIPDWAGNYYLAVELNLSACSMRVCGYTTHQQLRRQGKYDCFDETYCLETEDLIEDLSVMWAAQELYHSTILEVEPLPTLSASQAQTLLQNLNKATAYSPRLDVPFSQWGALIAQPQWRQTLYSRQQQQLDIAPTPNKTLINLGQWLQDVFEVGWLSLDAFLNTDSGNLVPASGFRQGKLTPRNVAVEGVKLIDLGMQLGNQSVALLVGLTPEAEQKVGIRVQLHPTGGKMYLPPNIKLALLSQGGKILQEFQSRSQDNFIQLKRFICTRGKHFSIQITLDNFSIKENFVIELQDD